MAVLNILTYPDPRLRVTAQPVTQFDDALKTMVNDMIETMYHDQGCGLAATQVGLPYRVFVADLSDAFDTPRHFINPEIIQREGDSLKDEGCLSFPGIYAKVKRPAQVTLRYFDIQGTEHEEVFDGLGAVCCDHEIQHLDGILFIDHLSAIKRSFLLKKLKKHQQRSA